MTLSLIESLLKHEGIDQQLSNQGGWNCRKRCGLKRLGKSYQAHSKYFSSSLILISFSLSPHLLFPCVDDSLADFVVLVVDFDKQ